MTAPHTYEGWTLRQKAEARKMMADGVSARDIAAHFGRTVSSIYHVTKGCRGRPGPVPTALDRYRRAYILRQSGLTWSRVAESMGLGREASACTYAKRYAKAFNEVPWPVVVASGVMG